MARILEFDAANNEEQIAVALLLTEKEVHHIFEIMNYSSSARRSIAEDCGEEFYTESEETSTEIHGLFYDKYRK